MVGGHEQPVCGWPGLFCRAPARAAPTWPPSPQPGDCCSPGAAWEPAKESCLTGHGGCHWQSLPPSLQGQNAPEGRKDASRPASPCPRGIFCTISWHQESYLCLPLALRMLCPVIWCALCCTVLTVPLPQLQDRERCQYVLPWHKALERHTQCHLVPLDPPATWREWRRAGWACVASCVSHTRSQPWKLQGTAKPPTLQRPETWRDHL